MKLFGLIKNFIKNFIKNHIKLTSKTCLLYPETKQRTFLEHMLLLLLLLLLAAMTYNQVHYFGVNHLADFTQNGHTKILAIHTSTNYMYGMSCTDSSRS